MNRAIPILVLLSGTVMGAFGAFYLKQGAQRLELSKSLKRVITTTLRNWQFLLGVTLYILGFLPYLFGLKYLPLTVAYPLTSMTYIWSAFLSKKYLNEEINAWRWAGICCIIVGIILLSI